MARKRLVAPEFSKHAELFDAEEESGMPIRVLFVNLWCVTDRRGVFEWKHRTLKLDVLPYDKIDFEAAMEVLVRHGFIQRYWCKGKRYGFIPSFERWQTFHPNEKASDAPGPNMADGSEPTKPGAATPDKPTNVGPVSTIGGASNAVTVTVTGTATGTGAAGEVCSSQPNPDSQPVDDVPAEPGLRLVKTEPVLPPAPAAVNALQPAGWSDSINENYLRLLDAGKEHEQLALKLLLHNHHAPAIVVLELFSHCSGLNVVRGNSNRRASTAEDIMRAVTEMAVNGKTYNVRSFREYVRTIIDRKPEPLGTEEKQAAEVKKFALSAGIVPEEAPRTLEEQEAAKQRIADAMAMFKAMARGAKPTQEKAE